MVTFVDSSCEILKLQCSCCLITQLEVCSNIQIYSWVPIYLSSVIWLEKMANKFLAEMSLWKCTSVEHTHFTNGSIVTYLLTALTVVCVCPCQILMVILKRYILQVRHLSYEKVFFFYFLQNSVHREMLKIKVWHIEFRIGCSIASWNDSADGFALCAVFLLSPSDI